MTSSFLFCLLKYLMIYTLFLLIQAAEQLGDLLPGNACLRLDLVLAVAGD